MYNIIANDGDVAYKIKEFACDTVEDLEKLPNCAMGSTAIVIATTEVYMKDSSGKWVKL